MVGAGVALAQKAPSNRAPAPDPTAEPDLVPGRVTPLAVDTFGGEVEPVDGTDDRTHLAYELRLTNITAANLTVERVRVLDPSRGGRVVDELTGDELASRIPVFGNPPGAPDKRFGPGVAGFVFMDVTYPAGARLPDRLKYRFDVSASTPTGLADSFRAGPTRVAEEDPARIGAPLFGKRWLTGEGCCATVTSHRGAIFPIDGTFHAPERFAIDWVKVGKNGRLYDGPKDELSSHPSLQLPLLRSDDPLGGRRPRGRDARHRARADTRSVSEARAPERSGDGHERSNVARLAPYSAECVEGLFSEVRRYGVL